VAWEEFQTNPQVAKVLVPLQMPSLPPANPKGRLTDHSGSFEMNDIRGLKRAREAGLQAEETRLAEGRAAREETRRVREREAAAQGAAKAAEVARLQAAWERCGIQCRCALVYFGGVRVGECLVKGMKKCSVCGDIKKSKCGKAPCKAALAERNAETAGAAAPAE